MKRFFTALVVCAFASGIALAEEKKDDAKKKEMMAKWMKYSTPSDGHKVFGELVGKWTTTSQWWEHKDSKPQVSPGTSTLKLVMGGRFLEHTFKGKSMGMPFEGRGFTGFNNVTKKYETLWLDNMATGMMTGSGSFDESSKTFKEGGEYVCPMTEKKRDYRAEWKIVDKNNLVYSMWGEDLDSGEEFKQMEIAFKRAK